MSRWHSLRWRLPLSISAVIVATVTVVLYAAYREVESALVLSNEERAKAAAAQVAGILDGVLRGSLAQAQQLANTTPVSAYLASPTPQNADAVLQALKSPSPSANWRVVLLWDAAGRLLTELPFPPAGETSIPALPPASPPTADGMRPLQLVDDRSFMEMVVRVTDEDAGGTLLGFVMIRSAYAVSPPGLFSRLVGDNSVVLLGNRDGEWWIDLATSRRAAVPGAAVGGTAPVGGLPFQVWAGFPRAVILAPARLFLRNMILLGVVVVVVGAVLTRLLIRRLLRPLATLTAATDAVAAGDYTRPVAVPGRDEFAQLGRAFEAMRAHVADDVARRADAARALQENEERLRYTLSAARVGTWEMDPASGEMRWSDTMGPLFGVPPGALPSRRERVVDVIHPDDREEVSACLLREADDRAEHETIFRALQPDGSYRWIDGRSRLTSAGGRLRLVGVCIDVTQQKTLEEQLRQSQKMDAIGKLAGGVAHDFNNMLTAILGFGTLLLEGMPADDARRVQIDEILKAARRAADLTSQLLAFSRQQMLQPVNLDVNTVVADIASMLQRLLGEHIRLQTIPAPRAATVRADPVQLQQILMNLSINGRDAMPEGGQLTIEIAHVELDESYGGQHFQVLPGPYVRIAVTDTGIGMTDAVRQRLFEPFFTTKKRGEGTGLGLATVYGAVKQAGGYIWAYGEPGKGSAFKVYLPYLEGASSPAVPTPVAPAAGVPKGKETILLVEDEEAVRLLTRLILERAGYRVMAAVNAEEAEASHQSVAGSIDLLLTDVVLPGISGSELYQRLSRVNPRLRVIYMSGYTDDTVFRTGRLQHGAAFVQKPFTADVLSKRIREVLDS